LGLVVTISSFLFEHGAFLPELVAAIAITAAFEECLQALGVTKQSDLVGFFPANQTVQLAKQDERN
jgi:hypothetical protein